MNDAIDIKGIWWLPDKPDEKIFGILTFTQEDGAYLNTLGAFNKNFLGDMEKPKIILGESQKGKPITLSSCIQISYNHSFNGAGESTYFAHIIFDGIHFSTPEDIKFCKVYANYFDLDGWVDISGFTIKDNFESSNFGCYMEYKKPSGNLYHINDDFSFGIGFAVHGPERRSIQNSVFMEQNTYFYIESRKGDIPFEEIFTVLNIYKDLFQFGIQSLPFIQSMYGYSSMKMDETQSINNSFEKIDIYFQPIETIRYKKPKHPAEMLFTFSDLSQAQVVNWFFLFNKYQSVINLYRGLFYQERLFIDVKFLNIAEALELLHNILFDNQVLKKVNLKSEKKLLLIQFQKNTMLG